MRKIVSTILVMAITMACIFASATTSLEGPNAEGKYNNQAINVGNEVGELAPVFTFVGSLNASSGFSSNDITCTTGTILTGITAYFKIDYTAYRYSKIVTATITPGDFIGKDIGHHVPATSVTSGLTAPAKTETTKIASVSKDFGSDSDGKGAGVAGSFGEFTVQWVPSTPGDIPADDYEATVTVTITTNS